MAQLDWPPKTSTATIDHPVTRLNPLPRILSTNRDSSKSRLTRVHHCSTTQATTKNEAHGGTLSLDVLLLALLVLLDGFLRHWHPQVSISLPVSMTNTAISHPLRSSENYLDYTELNIRPWKNLKMFLKKTMAGLQDIGG